MSIKKAAFVALAAALAAAAYYAGARGRLPTPVGGAGGGEGKDTRPAKIALVGFDPADIDLGDHLWDEVVPFQLKFINRGAEALTVSSVTASCGCTVIGGDVAAGDTVAPGQALDLSGTLNTQKTAGTKRRVVTLVAASGAQYSATLTVNIHGTYELAPDVLDFGEVDLEAPSSADPNLVFSFTSIADSLEGSPTPKVPWLESKVVEAAPGKTVILVALRRDQLAPGLNTGTVCVQTTSKVKPAACVYVRARTVRALTATPEHVFLVGDEVKRVRFTDRDGRAAWIAAVDGVDDRLTVAVLDTGEVEVSNRSQTRLGEAVRVGVRDVAGRRAVVLVSAY